MLSKVILQRNPIGFLIFSCSGLREVQRTRLQRQLQSLILADDRDVQGAARELISFV